MSKPKSILKKPSTSFPSASTSKHDKRALHNGSKGNNKARASGSKLRQSIPVKPVRPSKRADTESDSDEDSGEDFGEDPDQFVESELDTDEEISRSKGSKEKSSKTKRKAITTAETFGSTLTALLSEPGPSKRVKKDTSAVEVRPDPNTSKANADNTTSTSSSAHPILSLSHTKLPPSKASVSLERRAAKKVKQEKEEKEDRARVRDVVEGWTAADGTGGMEFEKGLRKVAQKGVIKLFNAILVASKSSESTATTLSAKAGLKEEKGRRKEKDNVLGRGGKVAEGKGLTSESFLDLVRRG